MGPLFELRVYLFQTLLAQCYSNVGAILPAIIIIIISIERAKSTYFLMMTKNTLLFSSCVKCVLLIQYRIYHNEYIVRSVVPLVWAPCMWFDSVQKNCFSSLISPCFVYSSQLFGWNRFAETSIHLSLVINKK